MAGEVGKPESIYVPERHAELDREFLLDFVEEYSFAMLITAKDGIRVSNVPTLLDRSETGWGKIWWHLAKSNPQNDCFDGATECVAVFHGPHAYVSPNWYETKNAVPTWNFAVVHLTGTPRRLNDDAAFADSLARLVAVNEQHYGGGEAWDYAQLPKEYVAGMQRGVVAYEMAVERVEAKIKLGQERVAGDRDGVLQGLRTGKKARTLAELTEAYYRRLPGV